MQSIFFQFDFKIAGAAFTGAPIPLFISLPVYHEILVGSKANEATRATLLPTYFKENFGIKNEADLDLLRAHVPFVFILDGIDELGVKFHLHRECMLHQWSQSGIIYGCRSGFLTDADAAQYLSPWNDSQKISDTGRLERLYLLPFNQQQVNQFIDKFAANKSENVALWTAQQYRDERVKFSALNEFGREPLTLFMVCCVSYHV